MTYPNNAKSPGAGIARGALDVDRFGRQIDIRDTAAHDELQRLQQLFVLRRGRLNETHARLIADLAFGRAA